MARYVILVVAFWAFVVMQVLCAAGFGCEVWCEQKGVPCAPLCPCDDDPADQVVPIDNGGQTVAPVAVSIPPASGFGLPCNDFNQSPTNEFMTRAALASFDAGPSMPFPPSVRPLRV